MGIILIATSLPSIFDLRSKALYTLDVLPWPIYPISLKYLCIDSNFGSIDLKTMCFSGLPAFKAVVEVLIFLKGCVDIYIAYVFKLLDPSLLPELFRFFFMFWLTSFIKRPNAENLNVFISYSSCYISYLVSPFSSTISIGTSINIFFTTT